MLKRGKCFPRVITGFIPVSDCLQVIIAVTEHHDQKPVVEERFFISLTVPYNSLSLRTVRAGTQAREELEARADAKAMVEYS